MSIIFNASYVVRSAFLATAGLFVFTFPVPDINGCPLSQVTDRRLLSVSIWSAYFFLELF